MLLRNHTGLRFWPLRGDQGENPAYAHSTQINFDLESIPLMTQDRLANYLLGLAVTFTGNIDPATALDQNLRVRDLVRGLIDNVELTGAWHGRPINPQVFRGRTLNIIERIACGYRPWGRTVTPFDDIDTSQAFRFTVFLPLCHGLGEKPHHSAQLALFYKDAQLLINTASAATLAQFTGGPVIANSPKIRCSAVLLPDPELRIGPANEWMEFRQNGAVAGSDQVDLPGLGNQTSLEGVEPGAAIDTMLALCGIAFAQAGGEAPDGSFTLDTLSRFSAPFLDQTQTLHLDPFMEAIQQMNPELGLDTPAVLRTTARTLAAGAIATQLAEFPYNSGGPTDDKGSMNVGGLFFPIRFGTPDLEVTKCPVFEGDATYYRTVSAVAATVDRTLVHQYKSWSPFKLAQAKDMIIQSGMALKVAKTNDLAWQPKYTRKNVGTVELQKARFLPLKLAKAA